MRATLSTSSAFLAGFAATLAASSSLAQTSFGEKRSATLAQGKFTRELKIFSGTAHPELARNVAKNLGTSLSPATIGRFNDGEVSVKIETSVRGDDVYVVQSTSPPVSDNLIELLLMISALRNASSRHVTAIVPYFGYMRSDGSDLPARITRKGASGETEQDDGVSMESMEANYRTSYLAMADVAKMFEVVGCSRVVTFDLHSSGQSAAEGFFAETQVENVRSGDIVAKEIAKQLGLQSDRELVVVAPHSSCFSKAKKFQYHLKSVLNTTYNVGLALVVRRPASEGAKDSVTDLVGDVKGKDVLIVEDVIDTGRSVARAARAAKEAGANRVFGFASHAVLSGNAAKRIQRCEALEKLAILNTVPISRESMAICTKFAVIDIAPMVANTVMNLHKKEIARPSS